MAARYWIGNGGSWTDTAHWSATSGGSGGETVPGTTDDVIFDAASFSATSAIASSVDVDIKSWDSSAIDQTLTWSLAEDVTIRGNFTLKSGQTINGGTLKTLTLSGTGAIFTTAGVTVNYATFKFTGTYTLNGNLVMPSITDDLLLVRGGTITTNNYNITTDNLTVDTGGSLILGSSTVTLGGNFSQSGGTLNLGSSTMSVAGSFTVSGSTVTPGTSTITLSASGVTIAGGGKTYYIVNFNGNNQTLTGSNTFNTFNLNTAGLATGLKVTAGTTQTVTNFASNGSAGNLAKILSTLAGTAFHLSTSSPQISETYMSIKDSYADQTLTWYATDSTDVSGNTNWIFTNPRPRKNTALGSEAGYTSVSGRGNVFLGYRAGYSELGNDKLYISNSETTTPLIKGDFAAQTLTITGTLTATSLVGPITATTITLSGQLTSTLADGTAPFVITSTTKVTNLNADAVDGTSVASLTNGRLLRYNSAGTQIENATVTESSGALGAITTISMSGQLTNTLSIGTAPFVITSTTKVTNLNADLLDDQTGSYYLDSANFTGTNWTDLTDGGATSLHSHAGGYTTLSQFVDETAWRSFYSNGSGDITALAFGDSGKVLTSGGASAAPTWETPVTGAVATDVIWDAKGDLAVGTGSNTAQKLTVGTNYYAPVADSGETTGIRWSEFSLTGWVEADETWTYASADDPTFTFTITGDLTGKYSVGMKIKLTQTTVKYFIITAIAYSAPDTTVTIYGGTDYDLVNAAISANFFSMFKAPLSFPLDPTKWTAITTNSSSNIENNPTQNTWYNTGTISLSIPIGVWITNYAAPVYVVEATGATCQVTLSTANNSESDANLTMGYLGGLTGVNIFPAFKEKTLVLAAKTTYYLNCRTITASVDNIGFRGDRGDVVIRAVCAFL